VDSHRTPSTDVIRAFLHARFRSALAGRTIGDDDALFSSGIIDSFGVLELIAFLEDTFGVTIDTARHDLREFDTVAKIRELLGRVRTS
jgi:acyl carrier protein